MESNNLVADALKGRVRPLLNLVDDLRKLGLEQDLCWLARKSIARRFA